MLSTAHMVAITMDQSLTALCPSILMNKTSMLIFITILEECEDGLTLSHWHNFLHDMGPCYPPTGALSNIIHQLYTNSWSSHSIHLESVVPDSPFIKYLNWTGSTASCTFPGHLTFTFKNDTGDRPEPGSRSNKSTFGCSTLWRY